ncbi:MAG: DNA polymerase III subunit beta [Nitrospirae bacterium]|nr:DNA polymerase III subunit beta [Nitrospirota bacterium]
MKIIVEKDEMVKKLADIQNIVDKKNTLPILSHFLLAADKESDADKGYITATDLQTAVKFPINLKVVEGGNVCVPARKLLEIAREMDGEITLETKDTQWIKVKSGKSNFRLACLSHEEFPILPAIASKEGVAMPPSVIVEMIDRVVYAAGESDTRYVFNGLLIHMRADGVITAVATDGHRLALLEKTTSADLKSEKKLIASKKSMSELKGFLDGETKDVMLHIGENHILFEIDDRQFLTRLIEGTFPSYEQVIPQDSTKELSADRELLSRSLKRVAIMSKDKSNIVKVDISPNNLVLSSSNPEIGEATDEVIIDYKGDAVTTAFNARYMLDCLNVMISDKVVFKFNEPLSPFLIMEEGREDYKCVVMPMRL